LQCLVNQETSSLEEDAHAFIHKAGVSITALCGKMNRLSVVDDQRSKEMSLIQSELTLAKEEITRLVAEVERLQVFKQKLEESGKRVAELETTIRWMEEEITKKERSWRALEEKLANEAASTYGLGFEAALEQVRLFCPSTNVSGADAGKVVVDGQIVEE